MPRVCNCCASHEAGQIAKAIAAGGSNRDLAVRFGVTESSVQRHRVRCLRAPRRVKETGAASETGNGAASRRFDSVADEITGPKDLLKRLAALFRLGDLLEEAYQRRDVDAVVKLAREYRAAAESYAKVAGWMVEGGSATTVLDMRRQQIAVLGELSVDQIRAIAAGQPIESTSKPTLALTE